MDDSAIVTLYWERQEQALKETDKKYGPYCWAISYNILKNRQDAEECVNDTYVRAWDTMPSQRPQSLRIYLGTIARNLSINVYRAKTARKRSGAMGQIIDELLECGGSSPEAQLEAAELGRALDRFLRGLPSRDATIFIRRYWHADPVADIAKHCRCTISGVKSSLYRSRKKLKVYLEKEGILP